MTGWKTKTGVIATCLTGLAMIITGLSVDPVDMEKITQGAMVISGAFTAFGVAHKIEKAGE